MSLLLALLLLAGQDSEQAATWRTLLKDGKVAEAVTAVEARAAKGDAEALDFLGWFYETGTGKPKDAAKATATYRRAAEAGSLHAQWAYGVALDMGAGIPEDSKAAMRWFERAADKGFRNAMISVGVMHSNGRGVPVDHAKALAAYQRAARAQAVAAFGHISAVYAHGEGVPKDPIEAAAWAIIGASYQDPLSRKMIEELQPLVDGNMAERAKERANAIMQEYRIGQPAK